MIGRWQDLDLFPIVERQIIHPVNMCLRYSTEVSFRVTAPEAEVQTLVGDMIRFNSPLPSNYDSDTSGCVSDATAARANEVGPAAGKQFSRTRFRGSGPVLQVLFSSVLVRFGLFLVGFAALCFVSERKERAAAPESRTRDCSMTHSGRQKGGEESKPFVGGGGGLVGCRVSRERARCGIRRPRRVELEARVSF